MTMNRTADVIARRLYAAGCRYAFGMPGGEVLTMVDALRNAGIRFVLAKHENAAGFMAEAAWHRTGAPGILLATLGPGVLNGVNSIANAWQDRVPLIVLSGCVDDDEAAQYTHQVLDQQAVLRPIVKASYRVSARAAHQLADKAVHVALERQMGPVHLDLPISVAVAEAPEAAPPQRVADSAVAPAGADLDTARRWLAEAERPLIVAGVDAMNLGAGPAIADFATKYSAPVITSYKAKGLLAEDHVLALGGAGLSPLADRALLPVAAAADLILCVGYDPIEMRPGWQHAWDPRDKRVIDITAGPNHHYMHQAGLSFIADPAASLAALSTVPPRATWPDSEPAKAQAELAAAFPADQDWGPNAIVDVCRRTLPRDALASADSGAHRILLSQQWECYEPRGLMQSSALCTMGCAVPLAIGAALCSPDRVVISFSGDAGFLMVAGELATAQELGVAPIFLVFVDASLALIEKKQRERQLPNEGVDFGTHDVAAIGRAFGGHGVDVRSRAELETALQDAMGADTFTVIAAHIDRGAYDGRI